jgi:hypothetical protein
LKPDEDYAKDATRDDGLALICRECNKAKCREWYQENRARAIARSQAYKAEHGRAPTSRGDSLRQARTQIKKRQEEEALSELKLIRLSPSEWLFCLQMGERLGLKPEAYIRYLVKDARAELDSAPSSSEHSGDLIP